MRRMPIPVRIAPFLPRGCPRGIYAGSALLSQGCPPDRGRLHTCYSPVRRSPAGGASSSPAAARLACVKPAASVHPEPGSNSPLLVIYFHIFLLAFVRPGALWLESSTGSFLDGQACRPCRKVRVPLSLISQLGSASLQGIASPSLLLVLWQSCQCSLAGCPETAPILPLRRFQMALFPDCGCKVIAFFRSPQILRQKNYIVEQTLPLSGSF